MKRLATIAFIFAACIALAGTVEEYAAKIAPQIDPAKLATLGPRGANPRVQRVTYFLALAKSERLSMAKVADAAIRSVGMTNKLAAELTKAAMLHNVAVAENHGCLNATGMAEMQRGRAATITRGKYAGDELSVDHIIPFAVVPELDHVIANLELMAQRANSSKNSKIGRPQRELASKLHAAGLLSRAGLMRVLLH